MAKYGFSFKVRQAAQVANSVAAEIVSEMEEFPPPLLSISAPETKSEVVFRYEGGVVVRIYLFDLDLLDEEWRIPKWEEWGVYQADTRFYPFGLRGKADKVEETWDFARLDELRMRRPFETPLRSKDKILGTVGVFFNRAANEGFIEVDPDYNTQGHCILVDGVPYKILIEGDLVRAERLAREILNGLLRAGTRQ